MTPPDLVAKLEAGALAARERAYAPYSKFRVGAALLTKRGNVFTGQNVENASYGLAVCAERAAVFAMVAAGEHELVAVAIATDAPRPTAPCGACRQVLREFATLDASVHLVTSAGARATHRLADLLPHDFGPSDLGQPEPAR